MVIEVKNLLCMDSEELSLFLKKYIDGVYHNYKYFRYQVDLYNYVVKKFKKKISETDRTTLNNEDITKMVYKSILKYIKKTMSIDSKAIIVINDYINEKIKFKKDYSSSIKELNKISKTMEDLDYNLEPNIILEIINRNELLQNIIKVVVDLDKEKYKEEDIFDIYDDYKVASFIQSYCTKNNIDLGNKEYDLEDFSINEDPNITRNPIRQYFNEIRPIPLLTIEEEQKLGYRILEGDEEAVRELAYHNLRLAAAVAKKYSTSIDKYLDVVQSANEGLIIAAKKFDVTKGFRFSTYAVQWIRQGIRLDYYKNDSAIKVPVQVRDRAKNIQKICDKIFNETQRELSIDELADYFNTSKRIIKLLLDSKQDVSSLQIVCGDDEVTTIQDLIEDNKNIGTEDESIRNTLNDLLYPWIDRTLTEKEKYVIICRFGLDGKGIRTLREIAQHYNVTAESIRATERNAINRLLKSPDANKFIDYLDYPEEARKKRTEYLKNSKYNTNPYTYQYELDEIREYKIIKNKVSNIIEAFSNFTRNQIFNAIDSLSNENRKIIELAYDENLIMKKDLLNSDSIENKKIIMIIYNRLFPKIYKKLLPLDSQKKVEEIILKADVKCKTKIRLQNSRN